MARKGQKFKKYCTEFKAEAVRRYLADKEGPRGAGRDP